MTNETIQARLDAANQRFADVKAQGDAKRGEIEKIEDELKRLQGEYRALTALLEEPKAEKEPSISPQADQVIVEDTDATN